MNIKKRIRKAIYDQINEMIDDQEEKLYAAQNDKLALTIDRNETISTLQDNIDKLKARLTPDCKEVREAFVYKLYKLMCITIALLTIATATLIAIL